MRGTRTPERLPRTRRAGGLMLATGLLLGAGLLLGVVTDQPAASASMTVDQGTGEVMLEDGGGGGAEPPPPEQAAELPAAPPTEVDAEPPPPEQAAEPLPPEQPTPEPPASEPPAGEQPGAELQAAEQVQAMGGDQVPAAPPSPGQPDGGGTTTRPAWAQAKVEEPLGPPEPSAPPEPGDGDDKPTVLPLVSPLMAIAKEAWNGTLIERSVRTVTVLGSGRANLPGGGPLGLPEVTWTSATSQALKAGALELAATSVQTALIGVGLAGTVVGAPAAPAVEDLAAAELLASGVMGLLAGLVDRQRRDEAYELDGGRYGPATASLEGQLHGEWAGALLAPVAMNFTGGLSALALGWAGSYGAGAATSTISNAWWLAGQPEETPDR